MAVAVRKKESPVRKLRALIGEIPSLAFYKTQDGFAQLIERSGQYVRVLESTGKINQKVALQMEMATGVSSEWLLDPSTSPDVILAAEGGELTPEILLKAVNAVPRRQRFPAAAEKIDPYEAMLDSLWASCRPLLLEKLRSGDSHHYSQMIALYQSLSKSEEAE